MNVYYVMGYERHTFGASVKISLVICNRGSFEVLAGLLFRTTIVGLQ